MLKLYNTLTRQKEAFLPLQPPKVNMYVCGVTVYDYCHIGHARAYVVFDLVRRYLEELKYQVNFIQNFTDIDDKIIRRAQENKQPAAELSEKFIQAYYEDLDQLNVKRATNYPRATENIPGMIKHIEGLLAKDFAYESQGEVFFRVSKFGNYGKLSGRKPDDNEAGARVEVNSHKENPLDFTLWKPAKPDEPSWASPWGAGRPGWHIECSVMSAKNAGTPTLDIHGGGQDLIFPHHENEIAQSEALSGQPLAKYWLHNGFVTIDKEKMSKSLGNFFSIREVFKKFEPAVIRFFLLSTHYRSPINYSDHQLSEAKKGLHYLENTLAENLSKKNGPDLTKNLKKLETQFYDFMDDDFNSAGAIGVLFTLATLTNQHQSPEGAGLLKKLGDLLGIFYQERKPESLPADVTKLIDQRNAARQKKDFAASDKLRQELENLGYLVKDTPQGTKVEKK